MIWVTILGLFEAYKPKYFELNYTSVKSDQSALKI